MKRLIKKSDWNNDSYIGRPGGLRLPDYEHKIYTDDIVDIHYGPSHNQECQFDKPIDNPEWALQNSF